MKPTSHKRLHRVAPGHKAFSVALLCLNLIPVSHPSLPFSSASVLCSAKHVSDVSDGTWGTSFHVTPRCSEIATGWTRGSERHGSKLVASQFRASCSLCSPGLQSSKHPVRYPISSQNVQAWAEGWDPSGEGAQVGKRWVLSGPSVATFQPAQLLSL